jgi:hypothetical protein
VPALRGNRIALVDGRPIAAREARTIRWLVDVDDRTRQTAERLLTSPGALRRDVVVNRGLDMKALAGAADSDPRILVSG